MFVTKADKLIDLTLRSFGKVFTTSTCNSLLETRTTYLSLQLLAVQAMTKVHIDTFPT